MEKIDFINTVVSATEARFKTREITRKNLESNLKAGLIFDANSPELIDNRISRLSFDSRIARILLAEGIPFPPYIAAASNPADPAAFERVLGTNDLLSIRFFHLGIRAAKAVARIQIKSPQGISIGYGTGFMVSPRLMLTNNHVLSSASVAQRSKAEFSFEIGEDGQMLQPHVIELIPDEFFATDQHLDYTLVAVRENTTLRGYGWIQLIEDQGKLIVGEWVNIIQHPNGEPKQIALRENQVIDELDDFVHYHTDTAPGSSGSPVFNDQWEVVALHHSGVPKRDSAGNILTHDNRMWTPEMGEHRIAWIANEGVRISSIVNHIKGLSLGYNKNLLRDELFSLPLHTTAGKHSSIMESPKYSLDKADCIEERRVSSITDISKSASWEIPLIVSINIGEVNPLGNYATPRSMLMPAQVKQLISPTVDRDLEDALSKFDESSSRVYYQENTDKEDQQRYYSKVDVTADSDQLFLELSRLLKSTHRNKVNYKPAIHVYPWVDLHPDRKLRSIYSGKSFDAKEFILADQQINKIRTAKLQEFLNNELSVSEDILVRELDFLESSLPYNCEHVVPQSWFAKREPMKGDLHHLFACESACNSFRSNIPYYDFLDYEEALRDSCGRRDGPDKFEPTSGKGAVARATLYFLLRYPGVIGDEKRELQVERLQVLLNWHSAESPDDYEKHRNQAIFEIQGNRNPLIDHPEWANKISFQLGFS
ncbi:endonuclease [Rheinheimera muenzenbergensis]|uniref:Serine protease n=1 Tax=Rheinheimera muenzenbergensis TaxID=1193628 RepID=A0ABU8CBQ1_9GAMM